jgi:hypothetical protein
MEDYVQLRLNSFPGQITQERCSTLPSRTQPPSQQTYPAVQLFLFHHEEHELLTDWLQCHGASFGLQNLHVIDHQSSDTKICRSLALYKACGVEVVDFRLAFNKETEALSSLMMQHNTRNSPFFIFYFFLVTHVVYESIKATSCTFLVPLDADEFIFNPVCATSGTNGLIGMV